MLTLILVGLSAVTASPLELYTICDGTINATFGGGQDPAKFGALTDLRAVGAAEGVIAGAGAGLWSASFVGAGSGQRSISSTSACAGREVIAASKTSVVFRWVNCSVALPPGPPPPPSPGPVEWVRSTQSNCAGQCLPGHSSGPKGGNCDRLPGCGHDAGLPYCDAEAMKARCLNVSGCTQFNTNGYLYGKSTNVIPFSEYPLECWSLGAPGPPTKPAAVSVTLDVQLAGGQLEVRLGFGSDGSLSLWDYTVSLSQIRTTASSKPVTSQAARQMTGLYDPAASSGTAVYFAAHDPKHVVKSCGAGASGAGATGSLHCTIDALNATLPLYQYQDGFPLVAAVLPGGDWWDIASTYRAWVLPSAAWTRLGPLDARTDMPDWLENITLWVNNNWGGDPLGPNYGGDPEHVKLEMLQLNSVLGLTGHGAHLALHWYEWDTLGYELGSNHTKCDRHPAPCGFDTHYPNYFPARVSCKESVAAMQAAGMRVIPYINGQLFDTLIPRWAEDNASLAVQKFAEQTMLTKAHAPTLTPHLEHFDGITSAVMCPHTAYWHRIMRDTVLSIVNDVGFDGCYVDQVGNGEQRNCADPTHNHSINGGSFWAEAFYSIMGEVRAGIHKPSGAMFMTEGIVEEVSGPGFDILLGLPWGAGQEPFWHAIYGGYGYATGRAGSVRAPLANGLCSELTQQFMAGGTMGWFTYQNYGDTFLDPANAQFVDYIRQLSLARIAAKRWMVHGRATRTLDVGDPSGALQGGCFLREKPSEPASIVCAVALPTNASAAVPFSLNVEPAKYGLRTAVGTRIALSDLFTGAILATFDHGLNVVHNATVQAFGVEMLKLDIV